MFGARMTFLGGGRACIGARFSQLEISESSYFLHWPLFHIDGINFTEVVLALLLDAFRFAPTDQKVIWRWNGVVQPTTEEAQNSQNGGETLTLQLKMSLA